jgi:hypothetical protein
VPGAGRHEGTTAGQPALTGRRSLLARSSL